MELNIRGDKITVTKSIKDYITEKMERLNKYFENAGKIKASVLIRVKNNEQIIEVTVPTSKFTLRAEEKHADLYAAIDLVMDKLERQIRKNKTRLNDRYKNIIQFEFPIEEETEEEEQKIVKRKKLGNNRLKLDLQSRFEDISIYELIDSLNITSLRNKNYVYESFRSAIMEQIKENKKW